MIYCDYGALATAERTQLLKIIYHHLKLRGKFLLDVFSLTQFHAFQESQTWEVYPCGDFWSPEKYVSLSRACKYPPNVTLRQTMVITNEKIRNYYLWDTCFSKDTLEEAENCGFKICGYFSDAGGLAYSEKSPTFAILLEK